MPETKFGDAAGRRGVFRFPFVSDPCYESYKLAYGGEESRSQTVRVKDVMHEIRLPYNPLLPLLNRREPIVLLSFRLMLLSLRRFLSMAMGQSQQRSIWLCELREQYGSDRLQRRGLRVINPR